MTDRFDKFTERARKVLQLAQEEAQRFNHNYIGTEHILLGLVRESEGVAARILLDFDADAEKIRSELYSALDRGPPPGPDEPVRWQPYAPPASEGERIVQERAWLVPLALGWSLFAVALALGLLLGRWVWA